MTAAMQTFGDRTRRQRELGARLRRVRAQKELSLAQVEARSGGRWKAVVVGAYERGDRAVTITRLAALADFYEVPLGHLLPPATPQPADPRDADGLQLDVTRLLMYVDHDGPVGSVARFADRIRALRGDHAGHILSLRNADLRTLALAADLAPHELHDLLAVHGLVTTVPQADEVSTV
jgi:transcriptional regulator with XRE-family HTH domain